jgi:DNA-directed RNA polymerase specialized sigma24 family protein
MSANDSESVPRQGWDRLLGLLDASGARAALKYRDLRLRLIRLFEWRGLPGNDLADETLERVARKLAEGLIIDGDDPTPYVCGVARLVGLEAARARDRLRPLGDMPEPSTSGPVDDAEAHALACLDECLGKLPAASRRLLLDYQVGDGGARIASRRRLAEGLGVPLNALRIRIHRLRAELERCVETCAADAGRERGDAAPS